jgi:hypothetical protein
VVDLELDSVALTENPSNGAAEIFIVRNKSGGPMAEPTAEIVDLQRRLQTVEAEKASKDAQIEELVRFKATAEAEKERAACTEIVRSVAPKVAVKGADMGDLVYRVRKAAAATGDKTLEADVVAVLRAFNGATEAAGALTRSLGTSATDDDASALAPEIQRAIQPFLKPGVTVQRAIVLAAAEAGKNGDNALYTTLSSLKVS